jgi:hypothetical protein
MLSSNQISFFHLLSKKKIKNTKKRKPDSFHKLKKKVEKPIELGLGGEGGTGDVVDRR